MYQAVVWAHRRLGLDPDDPATTWLWERFRPPGNSTHEADAPNRWHLLLLMAALAAVGLILAGPCRRIGLDITRYQLEYPLQALLLAADPGVRFVHTGVPGAPPEVKPWAVVCSTAATPGAGNCIARSASR